MSSPPDSNDRAQFTVDENVFVVLDALTDEFFELPARLIASLPDLEIAKDIRPRARIVFIEQSWRRDDKGASRKLLRKQSGHVGFSETDNVGEKGAAIFVERAPGGGDGVILIFQLFETHR